MTANMLRPKLPLMAQVLQANRVDTAIPIA
nr:hypothetical protein RP007_02880 [Rhizobium sp. P007]